MPRDYAARNRKPAAKPAGMPGWVWLVAGLSMGLVVAVIVYIGRPAQPMPMVGGAGSAGGAAQAAKPKVKVEIPPKEEPRFDFYTLLEDEQVVVSSGGKQPRLGALPDPPAAAPPEQKPAAPAAAPASPAPAVAAAPTAGSSGGKYLVLAGSFRDLSNAEQHRARLTMAGVEARIERIETPDGGAWHRVRIGPQPSQDRAEAVLAQLRANGFDGKVLKAP